MKNLIFFLFLGLTIFSSCHNKGIHDAEKGDISDHISSDQSNLKPDHLKALKVIRLSNGNIEVVFVDNTSFGGEHRAGYNGIAELSHASQDSSVFVPFYAGFNLEHIFGGDSLIELFEPRNHPMELYKISDTEVLLYQSPTPLSSVESRTDFKLNSPEYIDITFRFIIHDQKKFKHGYAGLFWASYIHAPSDKKINFPGSEVDSDSVGWIAAYSSEHGLKSTHIGKNEKEAVYFAPNFNARLASHFSDYKYDQAFYYGRFHNMVLAYMFHPAEGIRFSQSPTGGGADNPAWDFQFIVSDFEVGREYSFQARMVYKEFAGAKDVLEEYEIWKKAILLEVAQ